MVRHSALTSVVIEDIDGFVNKTESTSTNTTPIPHLQSSEGLINTYPFTSGRLSAKIANRFVHIPLHAVKKAFKGYFAQTDYVNAQIFTELDNLHRQIAEIPTHDLRPLFDEKVYEIAKLNDRLKNELMVEINKDQSPMGGQNKVATKIISESKYKKLKKVNLGSGSFFKEGYLNVDHREIEGVDMVADISDLPYKPNTLEEIFLSHVVEHFTELRIKQLPKY